jgi:hypothetical protein
MQFSPQSIFLPFWPKYLPQQPVLKNPQSMFFPQSERPFHARTAQPAKVKKKFVAKCFKVPMAQVKLFYQKQITIQKKSSIS